MSRAQMMVWLVVQEAIEDRRGEHLVAEDGAPLRDDLVGRDEQAAALVATGDELEEEMRAAPLERQVAELVDDEQLRLCEEARALGELALGLGLRERREERRRAGEEDRVAGLDDGAAERDREVRLADAGRAEEQHVLRAGR